MAGRALRMTSRVTGSRRVAALTDMDDQLPCGRCAGGVASEQQRGGGVLLDDRRPGYFLAGRQAVAVVDGAADGPRGVIEEDLAVAHQRIASGGGQWRELGMLAAAGGGHAHVHHLHRLLGRAVAVVPVVQLVIDAPDGRPVAGVQQNLVYGRLDPELLADVADIQEALKGDRVPSHALLRQHAPALFDELAEDRLDLAEVALVQRLVVRPHVVVAQIGEQHAQGGEVRRQPGHDDRWDVQLAGDGGRVHGAGAAAGYQGEVARVIAALDRHAAHRQRHLGHGDLDDGQRRLNRVHAQLGGHLLGDARARLVNVEVHLAAQETAGVDATQDDVSVSNGWLRAAPAVADGARLAAGALGADFQRADLVDPGDAAAASPDLDHVHHRQHHRVAAGVAADVVTLRDLRLVVLDQAGLGCGAAHVEGDHVLIAELLSYLGRGDNAANRARFHHRHGDGPGHLRRHHAPVGLHDQQPPGEAHRLQDALQLLQVAADLRPDVGVEDGRRGALVLAVLAQHLVRERAVDVGRLLGQDRAHLALVLWIRV